MSWMARALTSLLTEPLIGMADDDVFIQPRMLAAYAQLLQRALRKSPALYAGAFEYFSWRTRSMVATGWGRNLGEALFEAQVGSWAGLGSAGFDLVVQGVRWGGNVWG